MTARSPFHRLLQAEPLNFALTNRLPRRLASRFMGWFSKIEHPLVSRPAIRAWRFFADVDLSDASNDNFPSLHAAFVRALRPGARAVDPAPDVLVSPCDAIVGACGPLKGETAFQIKGAPYTLTDLLGAEAADPAIHHGQFVTLRLTAGMYHRFHAPDDLTLEHVTYFSGDKWNVNPPALKRVSRLFCRNERAVLRTRLADGTPLLIVPVAAILVAGIRLHALDVPALLASGRRSADCAVSAARGEELGWFEHGSTILLFTPPGFALADGIATGRTLRMGERLLVRAAPQLP